MALSQLKLLINLAGVDGGVAVREEKYIYNIGAANGISAETIKPLLGKNHDVIVASDLSDDEKFNYIFMSCTRLKM